MSEARLWSKAAEEKLRKSFLKEQRKNCHEAIVEYSQCSKANGLLVVLRCRNELHGINECLRDKTTEEQYQLFRDARISEWVAQGVLKDPR